MLKYAILLTALVVSPFTLKAQDLSPPESAQETAAQMVQVQQATALAQQQFSGMVAGQIGASYQGAIAVPGANDGEWLAIIVGLRGDGPDAVYVALAEYEIAGGAIVSEVIHLLRDAPVLDGVPSAMAQARSFAPRAVLATGASLCVDEDSAGSVNLSTIVMPPRGDARFDAYVLNGPIEEGAVPLGKHWRVSFDEFGLDDEPELLTDTCEVVTWTADAAEVAGMSYIAEHDGEPNAVHYFLSTLLPMDLVVTSGLQAWEITDGQLTGISAQVAE